IMNQSTLMNRFLNTFLRPAIRLSAPILLAGPGPYDVSKEMAPPLTITQSEPWHFNLGMPGWLAGVSGDIGLHGITSDVDVGFDQIIRHVKGIVSFSVDARYNRFGVYADIFYLGFSDAVYADGLVSCTILVLSEYLVGG